MLLTGASTAYLAIFLTQPDPPPMDNTTQGGLGPSISSNNQESVPQASPLANLIETVS